jgi:hypothetical protein
MVIAKLLNRGEHTFRVMRILKIGDIKVCGDTKTRN